MSETARIDSIAELRAFRVAIVKFVDACNVALGDAEGDMQRTLSWVERDQTSYWTGQLAKRAEMVIRAKEAVRMKKLYKSPTGHTQSAVEEEKMLRKAIALHEEAERKIVACKQWGRRLQKEIMAYKGGISRFTSVLAGDLPKALAKLEVMAGSLEAYAALTSGAGTGGGTGPAGAFSAGMTGGAMSRSADEIQRESYAPLDIAALRDSVPPPEARAAAPAVDIRAEQWAAPVLTTETRQAVVALNQSAARPEEADMLTVARGSWSAHRIFLERRAPAGPKDSGWHIAPAPTAGIVALNAVNVRDLLEVRPDFRELLTLPVGYLVVIDGDGIRSIFTPVGDSLWSPPPVGDPPAEESAESPGE